MPFAGSRPSLGMEHGKFAFQEDVAETAIALQLLRAGIGRARLCFSCFSKRAQRGISPCGAP